jgi:outer membrane protein assembly factor BamB
MTKYNWNGYPKTGRVVQNPPDTGALESDLAFDPTNGMVFAAVYNSPKVFQYTDVGSGRGPFNLTDWEFNWGVNVYSITQESPVNMTVMAIGGDSGQVKWSYFIPNLPYRGGLTVSGGVVYVSTLDGMLRFLGEADGSLLGQKLVGGELIDQPAIAQDESGHEMLFLTDLGSSRWGPVFPGFVQALSTTQASSPGSSQWLLPLALLVAASLAFVAGIAVAPRVRKKGPS